MAATAGGDMAVRMRKVLQAVGLVFEYVPCYFRLCGIKVRYYDLFTSWKFRGYKGYNYITLPPMI